MKEFEHRCPQMPPEVHVKVGEHTTVLERGFCVIPITYCPYCKIDPRATGNFPLPGEVYYNQQGEFVIDKIQIGAPDFSEMRIKLRRLKRAEVDKL